MMPNRDIQQMAPLTPAEFQILLILREGDLHGFGLMKQIKERTDGEMSLGPATMYRSLQGLEDKQLIKKLGKPAHAKKLRRDIYNYQITGQGCAAAEAELFRLAKMVDRAAKTLFQETSDTLWSGLHRLMREWQDAG